MPGVQIEKTSRRCSSLYVGYIVAAFAATSPMAQALAFNVSYDASVGSAPAGFVTDFNSVIQFCQNLYTDPITINIHVGWGELNGGALDPVFLGESLANQQSLFSYSQVRSILLADAKSAADFAATSALPTTDPYNGAPFVMSNAEAKALGLLAGNASGIDGWVGFSSNVTYTFDPNNRAAAGQLDFFGLASHEITEVMGRSGVGQNATGIYSPIDLFRYSSTGTRAFVPANGDYFSIDGGTTSINTFNGTGGGDLSDWSGGTLDSNNAFLAVGQQLNISAGDVTLMDVIGYDLAAPAPAPAPAPEPRSWVLLGIGLAFLLIAGYRRKSIAS
jgi:hypothetical protein